jgi:DNA-binding MarR family transcriptional regulator
MHELMQDNPSSTSLGFLISDTARLLRKRFDQRAREIGLTRAQWQVLAYLKHNEGINQGGLADLMEVEPITLSRHLEKMEEAGWVARRPDPNDKRVKLLFLSEHSGAVLDEMRVIARSLFDEALAGLPPEKVEHAIEALQHIRAAFAARPNVEEEAAPPTEISLQRRAAR